MDDKIDFYDDVNKLSTNITITKNIGSDITLNLQSYDDVNVIDLILKWKSCLSFLGKDALFITKKVQQIIYCLLSDCTFINSVNNQSTNLTFYDKIRESFMGFDVVTKTNRNIKIKLFNVCNEMVIIDCSAYPIYKVYYLYNLDFVKDFYKSSKVNFDTIMEHISLVPVLISDINNLVTDYKKLSVYNLRVSNNKKIVRIDTYLKNARHIEAKIEKIQHELFDIYKNIIINK